MVGLPGMPGSKGLDSRGALSKGGNKPPMLGSYKSNLGAGFNKNASGAASGGSMPSGMGLNAFNVPKYGSGGGIGGGIGLGGLGGGMGSNPSLGLGDPNRSGNSRSSNRAGSNSGMGRHKY